MSSEEWSPIEGYEGLYEVSTHGNVKSLKRKFVPEDSLLTKHATNRGYEIVHLRLNGKQNSKLVHRLVAQAFVSNPEDKKEVNNKDGIKTNNYMENLEWVSSSENHKHAYENGLMKTTENAKIARGISGKKFNIQRSKMIYQLHPETKNVEKIWMSKSNAVKNLGVNLTWINYRIKNNLNKTKKHDFKEVYKPNEGFLIIVEGSDCSGKSTLINKLSKSLNIPVFKGSDFSIAEKGIEYMYNYMREQYSTRDYIILDRSFISNLVYAPIFDKNMLSDSQQMNLIEIVKKKSMLIYLKGDEKIILERLANRGDEYIHQKDVSRILNSYDTVMSKVKQQIDVLEFDIKEYSSDDIMKIVPNILRTAGIYN